MQKIMQHIKQNPLQLFAFITVFSIVVIGWNIFSVVRLDNKTRDVVMYSEELAELEEVQIFLLKQELAELEYLLTGDPAFIIRHKEFETLANFHIDQAQRFQTRPEEQLIIDQIIVDRDAYEEAFIEVVALYDAGDVDEAILLAEEVGESKIQDVHRLVEEYVTVVEMDVQDEISQANRIAYFSIAISVIALIIFILLAVISFSISNRILRPIVLLTVIISVLVIGWNIQNLWRIDQAINDAVHTSKELAEIEEVQVFLLEQEIAQIEYLLSGTDEYADEYKEYGETAVYHLDRAIALQQSEEEAALLESVIDDLALYNQAAEGAMAAYLRGDLREAKRLSVEEVSVALDHIHEQVETYVVEQELQLEDNLETMDRLTQIALTIGIFTLVIFAVEAVVSTTITGQVLTPVMKLIDAAESIENETYDTSMLDDVVLRQDEIGRLAQIFQHMSTTIYTRTEKLKAEVVQLKIDIDESKSSKQVEKIVSSDFFKGLEDSAEEIRKQRQERLEKRRQGGES